MRRMTAGSMMKEMMRILPPQFLQSAGRFGTRGG
jgi:hypothetical protein